jgi:hypothetical protein
MRTLVPSSLYRSLSSQIADRRELDDALAALYWALRNKADDYPIMPGYRTLRMAKTDAVRDIPALYVIFSIRNDNEVELRYIEVAVGDEFQGPPLM